MRECPVCLGVPLKATAIPGTPKLEIDHCERCGGVWFEQGEVEQLRRRGMAKLWKRVVRNGVNHRMACRGCEARLHRDADACGGCGWQNVIDCPVCARPMERESRTGLRLDVCRGCRGAWFDNHELELIWQAVAVTTARSYVPAEGGNFDDTLDILIYGPDVVRATGHLVRLAADGATAAAEAAPHLPEVAAGGFEAAVSLVEMVGDAAGSVFEVIGAIFELLFGLFDGL